MTENETNVPDANQAPQVANQTETSSDSQPGVAETTAQEPISQKRFNTVYWQKKQAERKANELQAKIDELNNNQQNVQPIRKEVQSTNEPTIEQFDYDADKYSEALINHRVQQGISKAFEARDNNNKLEKEKANNKKVSESYNDKLAQYVSDNPDYEEIAKIAGNKIFSPHINQAILHTGPELDHYLLSNPAEAEKIQSLSVPAAMMELGKISAKFGTQQKQTKTTGAPPPIETVGGGGTPNVDRRFDPNISMEEYYKVSMEGKP